MVVSTRIESPLGELLLRTSDAGLIAVDLPHAHEHEANLVAPSQHPVLAAAAKQLREYFAGSRREFELPLAAQGTAFQIAAWRELTRIPYGHTISYAEQAKRLGSVRKARAVGGANSRNPLAILIPCHRVIATDGSIGGYSGGLQMKRFLLNLEQTHRSQHRS